MDDFEDFLLGTSERPMHGPDQFHNFAGERKFLKRIFMGAPRTRTVQGGKEFSFYVMFDEQNTARDYKPGDIETPTHHDVMKRGVGYWRRTRDHDTYVEDEIMLNEHEDEFEAWFHTAKVHSVRLATSLCNFFESILFRVPDTTEMEASGGKQAYSLLSFNNEYTNGLPDSFHPGGAWSTIHGLSPTEFPSWKCQQVTYGKDGAGAKDGPADGQLWSAFKAFDVMERITHFDSIPDREALYRTSSGQYVIITDGPGLDMYRTAARASNDNLRYSDGHDPAVPYVKFNGIDLLESSHLRDQKVYPTGASGALSDAWDTANATPNSGSRFHWWNLGSLACVKHKKMWMYHRKPKSDVRQPDTLVVYVDSWYQFVCEELRVNGTVYPDEDVVWVPSAA